MRAFTTILFLFICLSAYAQFKSGDRYFSSYAINPREELYNDYITVNTDHAELSFSTDERSQNQFLLGGFAEFGRFRSNQSLMGTGLALGLLGQQGFSTVFAGFAPFGRWYFRNTESSTRLYAQAQAEVLLLLGAGDVPVMLGGNLRLGATHFLSDIIALDSYFSVAKGGFLNEVGTTFRLGTQLSIYFDQPLRANRFSVVSGIDKGSWILGGTTAAMGWNSGARGFGSDAVSVNLSPNVYYFFADRLALGTGLTIAHRASSFRNTETGFRSTQFSIIPQLRYYLGAKEARQQWFFSGGFSYTEAHWLSEFFVGGALTTFEGKEVHREIGVGIGLNSFLRPNLAVELGPNLRYEFGLNSYRLAFDVGLQYFFNPGS